MDNLAVRESTKNDFEQIVDYFLGGSDEFLLQMGVERGKLPGKPEWLKLLKEDFQQPLEQRKFYYVIWLFNNSPVGHSNINKIVFAEEAYVHLHMWASDKRQKGNGLAYMKMSIPYYFTNFKLKNLYCEPYALNIAPNKMLEKLGFDFIKQYETTPGWISFHQPVNRWQLNAAKYKKLFL